MDIELKCNRLTCRKGLADKAVVTTCSHIFCIDCANELFTAARLCPACETSLTEPDDIVVCSLQPTNDYKTQVGPRRTFSMYNSGDMQPRDLFLAVSNSSRKVLSSWTMVNFSFSSDFSLLLFPLSFFVKSSFQQAVIRNLSDKNAQLQKQLDNVVREANGEIHLLSDKIAQLERDLEVERRKVRDLQETSRERDKEYQKLKIQHDKLKRKALLGPATMEPTAAPQSRTPEGQQSRARHNYALGGSTGIEAAMSGMEMNGVQRTPLMPRVHQGHTVMVSAAAQTSGWNKPHRTTGSMTGQHRQPFGAPTQVLALDRSFRTTSDYSDSGNEVEQMLLPGSFSRSSSGWAPSAARSRPVFAPPIAPKRASMGFRPAGVNR